jgi:hypothetical protein
MKRCVFNFGICLSTWLTLAIATSLESSAQTVGEPSKESPLKISVNLEVYYRYDLGNPSSGEKLPYQYTYDRHNEVNLNLGMIAAQYSADRVRANLALMAGTYPNANLAAEPGVLKNVFEANVGYQLHKNKSLWVDMGILPSHIGFESAIGSLNRNLTRSLLADNSPYFESGVRLSYTSDSKKWYLAALALNGWQRIQRLPGNSLISLGTQVTWTPSDRILFNSSTFIGSDTPDSERKMRYFHNFYSQLSAGSRWRFIVGLDYGIQQSEPGSKEYDQWLSPVLIPSFQLSERLDLSARLEWYSDPKEVIVQSGTEEGFELVSTSVNLDLKLSPQLIWRSEYRFFSGQGDYFPTRDLPSDRMSQLTTSLAFSF